MMDVRSVPSGLDLGGHGHEIVAKLSRALTRRYSVNCIAVRPERYGSVANRNRVRYPASRHHGCGAEAGGKAKQGATGGKATEAAAVDKHSCISPDTANHSNTVACARFSISEARHA
jgi:hypothetical protein